MTIEVKLPELGDGIESGDVLSLMVAEGDVIAKDTEIVELETDKATLAVPSSHGGRVAKIHVKPGDTVAIGGVLLTLEESSEAETGASDAPSAPEAAKPESSVEEPPPEEALSEPEPQPKSREAKETEATEQPGDEPETPARPPAEPVPGPAAAKPKSTTSRPEAKPATIAGEVIPAGPAVRRFAREVGVDLAGVTGTGEHGRITRDDVLAVVRQANRGGGSSTGRVSTPPSSTSEAPESEPASSAEAQAADDRDQFGPVRRERLSRIRRAIAEQMHRSWTTAPRVTNFDDADITELERIRQGSKADYAAAGVKLTALPFVIKAVAHALRAHPMINASIDMDESEVVYKQYVNIGVAVDTDRGLVVPALREADQQSISEIARALAEIAEKARSNEFTLDDLRGGTFTISNLGAIGGTYSTPIINVPEAAILLVGRARKMPVVMDDDRVEVRLMMPLSLSYDHRLVDGAAAARFLNDVIDMLETPSRLLLAP